MPDKHLAISFELREAARKLIEAAEKLDKNLPYGLHGVIGLIDSSHKNSDRAARKVHRKLDALQNKSGQ